MVTWDDVLVRYENPSVHDAFINSCSQAGALGHAVDCYQKVLQQRPGDAVAIERLAQIRTRLMFEVETKESRGEPHRALSEYTKRWLSSLLGISLIVVVTVSILGPAGSRFEKREWRQSQCDSLIEPLCSMYILLQWSVEYWMLTLLLIASALYIFYGKRRK